MMDIGGRSRRQDGGGGWLTQQGLPYRRIYDWHWEPYIMEKSTEDSTVLPVLEPESEATFEIDSAPSNTQDFRANFSS